MEAFWAFTIRSSIRFWRAWSCVTMVSRCSTNKKRMGGIEGFWDFFLICNIAFGRLGVVLPWYQESVRA